MGTKFKSKFSIFLSCITIKVTFNLLFAKYLVANPDAKLLLDGYIEIHKLSCIKDDCPLKSKKETKQQPVNLFRRSRIPKN